MTDQHFKSAFNVGDIVLYKRQFVSVVTGHEYWERRERGEAELLGWSDHGVVTDEDRMILLFTAEEVEERKRQVLNKKENETT